MARTERPNTEVDDGCSGLTLPSGGSCAVAIDFLAYGHRYPKRDVHPDRQRIRQPAERTDHRCRHRHQPATFSLTVTGPPAPSPSGCQTGGVLSEALSGSAFNGQTPRGSATSDETRFSGCGGYSVLTVQVSHVNLPDGSQLWATLDFKPVGAGYRPVAVSAELGTSARRHRRLNEYQRLDYDSVL